MQSGIAIGRAGHTHPDRDRGVLWIKLMRQGSEGGQTIGRGLGGRNRNLNEAVTLLAKATPFDRVTTNIKAKNMTHKRGLPGCCGSRCRGSVT